MKEHKGFYAAVTFICLVLALISATVEMSFFKMSAYLLAALWFYYLTTTK